VRRCAAKTRKNEKMKKGARVRLMDLGFFFPYFFFLQGGAGWVPGVFKNPNPPCTGIQFLDPYPYKKH
jgi:hypothetical protein